MSTAALTGSMATTFGGESLVLLPDRALWWPGASTLVIADLHIGKDATFRHFGIPVPAGGITRDLARLGALLRATGAERLVILGDLLHARAGRVPEAVEAMTRWREEHAALAVVLVRGNHDRAAGRVPGEWRMEEVEEPHADGALTLLHHPETDWVGPGLAGHVHPVTSLQDFDGSIVSIPSFIQDTERLILPAFGSFTGGYKMRPEPGRQIFLTMAGRVLRGK